MNWKFWKKEVIPDQATSFIDYIISHGGVVTKNTIGVWGGSIEGRVVTDKGVSFLKQDFILHSDIVEHKPKKKKYKKKNKKRK